MYLHSMHQVVIMLLLTENSDKVFVFIKNHSCRMPISKAQKRFSYK